MLLQGEGCGEDKGEWQQTRQRYDKSPTSKFTPLGLVSGVTVIYFVLWGGGEKRRGPMPLGLFLVSIFFWGGGHLPQSSGFRSAKQIHPSDVRST